ncbi:hypothetical protein [Prosthecobacter dejongeii]|uniref:Uncharacterized protein n=1 Tax=Prosthecobacter dejongeii TaxID=48465 RepID=A0A7W7YM38_9BACT|nr:hypothetical protein [Prosthecobacter dejongeii]MBB5038713.1 hypothetical protein [Prosthecobacter dejongeii]
MQESILLIPPTDEQSVFSFHLVESLLPRFITFLEQKNLTPWRTPTALDKTGPDGQPLYQVDVDSPATQAMMEDLRQEFLGDE